MKDFLKVNGRVRVRLNGVLVREVNNKVVLSGRRAMLRRAFNIPFGSVQYMAIGSGNIVVSDSQTSLGNELGRVQFPVPNDPDSTATITAIATFGPGVGTGGISEAGMFDTADPANTTMFSRATFDVLNKLAGDTIEIDWQIQLI